MIKAINPHNRLGPDFPFPPGGAVGARLLKSSNRFPVYSFYPIELKLGRMILDVGLHNQYEQEFLGGERVCQNFGIFADAICTMFPCLAVAEISVSSI